MEAALSVRRYVESPHTLTHWISQCDERHGAHLPSIGAPDSMHLPTSPCRSPRTVRIVRYPWCRSSSVRGVTLYFAMRFARHGEVNRRPRLNMLWFAPGSLLCATAMTTSRVGAVEVPTRATRDLLRPMISRQEFRCADHGTCSDEPFVAQFVGKPIRFDATGRNRSHKFRS